ncbi:MAG: hypothetical protein ACRYFU_06745 [Janthinobacterium lividum]
MRHDESDADDKGGTKRSRFLLLAFALFVTVAATSLLPTQDKHRLHTQGLLHPWLHIGAFCVLTFLLFSGVRSPLARVVIFLAMLAFGWGSEFAEHLNDQWPIESRDVLLDSAGTSLGAILGVFLRFRS